jgi:hypothetical protein
MPTTNARTSPVEKPVLLEAINCTFRTLEQRTRQYRNLVIAVSLTGVGSIILAVILRRWIMLVGELALPLYFVCFLFFDKQVLIKWRLGVFKMRDEQGLSIAQLTQTLMSLQHLPQSTLRSMLAMLTSTNQKK